MTLGINAAATPSAYPVGAGRTLDILWPASALGGSQPVNGTNVGFDSWVSLRGNAMTPINGTTTANSITGTGTIKWGTGTGYRGRGVAIFAAGAGGTCLQQIGAAAHTPPLEPTVEPDLSYADPLAYARTIILACFETPGALNSGVGFHWSAPNVGSYDVAGGAAGWGFVNDAAGVVSLVRRSATGGGVLIKTPVFTPPNGQTDLRSFNAYEIITHPARAGQFAKMRAYVNGLQVIELPLCAGGGANGMPTHAGASGGGAWGFLMMIGCVAGTSNANGSQIAVAKVHHMRGPTEASLR